MGENWKSCRRLGSMRPNGNGSEVASWRRANKWPPKSGQCASELRAAKLKAKEKCAQ